MNGHIGLREEARAGRVLAWRIARLFATSASRSPVKTARLGNARAQPTVRRADGFGLGGEGAGHA